MTDADQLRLLVENLLAADGHYGCDFTGCTCGGAENYKAARAELVAWLRDTCAKVPPPEHSTPLS